jgi:hypothetical protein
MEMTIKQNTEQLTYTITIDGLTYETPQLTTNEFEELEYNTYNDWKAYIRQEQLIIK